MHSHLYSRYSIVVWMHVCLQKIHFCVIGVYLTYGFSFSLSTLLFPLLLINNRVIHKVPPREMKLWVRSCFEETFY